MADTFDVVVQVYDDVSGELKGDANVKTSAGMTYFSDGESLQEKVDSGEFTSGEQGPEGPPGPNSADLISVVDTEGLLGTPGTVVMSQNLFDAIVDSVANKLLPYARLANNGLTTEEGFALDARYGKTLKELFDSVNSNLTALDNKLILKADCKYLAQKQYTLSNTGGNSWINISLFDLGITGKKLPDNCAPTACVSWFTGNGFWVTYCHRYDDTTLQVGFNTSLASAFRVTLLFGLIDA